MRFVLNNHPFLTPKELAHLELVALELVALGLANLELVALELAPVIPSRELVARSTSPLPSSRLVATHLSTQVAIFGAFKQYPLRE